MKKLTLLVSLIVFSQLVFADDQKDSADESYKFTPVLLDGSDNAGAVLGLRYRLEENWTFFEKEKSNTSDDSFGSNNNFSNVIEQLTEEHGFVEVKLEGIWTNDKDLNPESFSKLNLDIGYLVSKPDDIETDANEEKDYDFSLQLAVEGDQNYSDTQTLVALQAGTLLGSSTDWFVGATLAIGKVNASNNDQRMALTNVDNFDRVSAELHFQYPLSFRKGRKYSPKAIAFNYRYHEELSAPDIIETMNLDVFQYGAIRLKFEHGIYLGYANGKLPFDLRSESSVELGFSQNLF